MGGTSNTTGTPDRSNGRTKRRGQAETKYTDTNDETRRTSEVRGGRRTGEIIRRRHRGRHEGHTTDRQRETDKKGLMGKYRGENIVERAGRGTLRRHKEIKR